ncbi:MAG: hypothetical protein NTW06_00015, partial [Candidatus Falkowbacteria bacterium]|nr:hypothetical protein [Candidatus Falkowbacteria bacterium]
MSLLSLSGLVIAITTFVLLIILLIYGKAKIHRIWMLFNFTVFIWGLGTFLVGQATTPQDASLSWKIAGTGGLFISVLFYHTINILLDLKKQRLLFIVYLQAVFFWALMCFTKEGLIFANWRLLFSSLYYNQATIGYTLMMSCWALVACLGHYELWKFLKTARGLKRTQAIYFLIAFAIGFTGGGLVLLPAWGVPIYPIGNFGIALYVIIGTYAILRYRVMDIKVVLRQYSVFLFSFFVVALPTLYLKSIYEKIVPQYIFWVDFALLFIAVYFFPICKDYFYHFANKYLFSSLYDSAEVIAGLSDKLRSTLSLANLYG